MTKQGFLRDANGNKSSKRLITAWLIFLATYGFLWTALAPIFHIIISDNFVTLTKTLFYCAILLGTGGTAAEKIGQPLKAINTGFLANAMGTKTLNRAIAIWLAALVTGGYIWGGFASLFHTQINNNFTVLIESICYCIVGLGVGGTAAEQLKKLKGNSNE